ncbi:hypothetical protein BJ912DRAFT_936589 [Pholiota molesta]|nr:hypothetical protein BJ912DRAFT_936589 [Pholiota molesta]
MALRGALGAQLARERVRTNDERRKRLRERVAAADESPGGRRIERAWMGPQGPQGGAVLNTFAMNEHTVYALARVIASPLSSACLAPFPSAYHQRVVIEANRDGGCGSSEVPLSSISPPAVMALRTVLRAFEIPYYAQSREFGWREHRLWVARAALLEPGMAEAAVCEAGSSSCGAYLARLEIGVDRGMTPVPWVLFLSERGMERCDAELCGGWWCNLFNMMLVCLYILLIIFILKKNVNVFVTQYEIPSLSFPLSRTESFNITHCDVPVICQAQSPHWPPQL